jgi:hypothetical protein
LNQKAITITLLTIMGASLLFASISNPQVLGQSPYGLRIFYITAQGGYEPLQNATVGQPVSLLASVVTSNGSYRLYFNNKLIESSTSQGYYIDSNFTMPEVPLGTYDFILTDVAINQNTTLSLPILTAFSAKPTSVPTSPSQLAEGSSVALNVTVLGGSPNTSYGAEIRVVSPNSVLNFTKSISFTTSSLGTAQALVTYPDSSFSPSGASTLYAGSYVVYFNQTQGLAQSTFNFGFTDLTQYHRQDTVKINALGYQPSQVVTVAVSFNNAPISSQPITASSQGVITTTWVVPNEAAIGTYTVTLSPQTNPSKLVVDTQTFTILGYPVNIKALNLAGEIVPQISIEATDQAANQTFTNVTDLAGMTTINLEKGATKLAAYWNQVKVGEITLTVTGTSTNTITCQLTDLSIKVQDKRGVVIPFANLNVTYPYVTRTGETQTGTTVGQTDLTGIYTLNSTLPGIIYSIVASKFSTVFNQTSSSVSTQPTSQITVICPDETLSLKLVDYTSKPLTNTRVTLIEQASGIFYSVTTDSSGTAQLQVTFGQYRLDAYTADNILLNETVINVLSNTQTQITCTLYNLQVSVKIVDYFGAPISNVYVQLSRPGMNAQSGTTKSDGTATFSNVIGGNMEITAYPTGNEKAFVAKNLQITSPTTVTLSMAKYVLFGGSLVDTSVLATITLVAVVILLLMILEVYRRTGFRLPRKSGK